MTRPPSQCQPEAGAMLPVIDRNRCDGKQDCVAVCPFDVFAMQRVTALDLAMLPVAPRKAHKLIGKWQAFTVRAEACHACNLCVVACPKTRSASCARLPEHFFNRFFQRSTY